MVENTKQAHVYHQWHWQQQWWLYFRFFFFKWQICVNWECRCCVTRLWNICNAKKVKQESRRRRGPVYHLLHISKASCISSTKPWHLAKWPPHYCAFDCCPAAFNKKIQGCPVATEPVWAAHTRRDHQCFGMQQRETWNAYFEMVVCCVNTLSPRFWNFKGESAN